MAGTVISPEAFVRLTVVRDRQCQNLSVSDKVAFKELSFVDHAEVIALGNLKTVINLPLESNRHSFSDFFRNTGGLSRLN